MTLSFEQLQVLVEQYRKQFGSYDDQLVAPLFYVSFCSEGEPQAVKETLVLDTANDFSLAIDIDSDGRVLGIEFF